MLDYTPFLTVTSQPTNYHVTFRLCPCICTPSMGVKWAARMVRYQGRRHRCGRCGHGRTTFSLNLVFFNTRSKGTQVCSRMVPDWKVCTYTLVSNGVWLARLRTHVVRPEGFGDHIAFPSRSFGKSALVNRSFQVTIWVLMAPNSISEHANFKKFRGGGGGGGGACPQTPLDKCALHTKHPEPETVAS